MYKGTCTSTCDMINKAKRKRGQKEQTDDTLQNEMTSEPKKLRKLLYVKYSPPKQTVKKVKNKKGKYKYPFKYLRLPFFFVEETK